MSCEIELELTSGGSPGEFTTRVVRAAAGGEPSGTMRLDVDGLLRDRDVLETTVVASGVAGRGLPRAEAQLRQVGRQLFDSLFSGPVLGAYRASLGAAVQQGRPLRVVLRFAAPELAALPWEAMFDPDTDTYICRNEPLVRHVAAPYAVEPLDVVPPLRVLGLVASPSGMPTLDVGTEQQRLTAALADPIADGLIELEWLAQASWEAVQEKLLSGTWHVLHFIGHGDYDVTNDRGLIALVGADGRANPVEARRLADLLNEAHPTPRLVVLNSCSSGEEGTRDLFSGTAATLVRGGIGAVAAMQFTVSDAAAIAFSRGFYTAVANGHNVDDAVRSGRIAILGLSANTLEWVTPVLYVRGETTQLFNVQSSPRVEAHRKPRRKALATVIAATTALLLVGVIGLGVHWLKRPHPVAEDQGRDGPAPGVGDPVVVTNVTHSWSTGAGITVVLPAGSLPDMSELNKRPHYGDDQANWLLEQGAAPAGTVAIQFRVAGNRPNPVTIIGVKTQDQKCLAAYSGAMFLSAPQDGGDKSIGQTRMLAIDLDHPSPRAKLTNQPGGVGGTPGELNIGLKKGEPEDLIVVAAPPKNRFCSFKLAITTRVGTDMEQTQVVSDANGQPFRVTALMDLKNYQDVFYNTAGCVPDAGFMRVPKSWPGKGCP